MSYVSQNIAAALLALALAVTGALLGCRTQHLGDDTGQAYDRAFAVQAKAGGEDTAGIDADDARQVMTVHRHGPQKADGAATTATGVAPVSGNTSGSGNIDMGGAWPGAEGNITLEAK